MSKTLDELSVVIPVYDEAANIAGLLGEIEARLDGRVHHEVIVVDYGSIDDTLERLGAYAASGDFPCGSCAMRGTPARARRYATKFRGPMRLDRDLGWRRAK